MFDSAPVIDTIPDSEKFNAVGRFKWQATSAEQLFVEGTYYHGWFVQRVAPSPLYSPSQPGDFTLPPSPRSTLPRTSPACRKATRRSGWKSSIGRSSWGPRRFCGAIRFAFK
ncbi:MAG: hypothetical protein ACM3NZ_13250 [Betaproteobacteria bacterium]|jgi:hypothetical protein